MDRRSASIAVFVFAGIALVLVIYSWAPDRSGLTKKRGRVTGVSRQPGTMYRVELITESGTRISCRGRRQWPPAFINRCPIEKLEPRWGEP